MPFALLFAAFTLALDLLRAAPRRQQDLAVEGVVLRQQVRMYQRKAQRASRLSRWDKVLLAAMVTRCRALAGAGVIVQPETVLRWHREREVERGEQLAIEADQVRVSGPGTQAATPGRRERHIERDQPVLRHQQPLRPQTRAERGAECQEEERAPPGRRLSCSCPSLRDRNPARPLADLDAALRAEAGPPHAANTRKAYASDWADFATWCARYDLAPLPAEALTVRRYLVALARDGKKVATIGRRLAAIADAHARGGHPSPAADPAVRHELAALRRDLGVAPRGKEPVLADDLRAMVAALPEDPRGLGDRAMLLLGFAAALRRSELVGLDVGDIAFAKRGLVVTIRRSKSDQEGAGATVAVAPGSDPAAGPVRAIRRWLGAARLGTTGPLFRPVHRTGKVLDRRLNPEHVAQLVKHAAAAAGVAPTDLDGAADTLGLAGHSLRAGLVTQAALDGVSDADIAATTRHKSRDMVARYTRIADPFRTGVAGKVKL